MSCTCESVERSTSTKTFETYILLNSHHDRRIIIETMPLRHSQPGPSRAVSQKPIFEKQFLRAILVFNPHGLKGGLKSNAFIVSVPYRSTEETSEELFAFVVEDIRFPRSSPWTSAKDLSRFFDYRAAGYTKPYGPYFYHDNDVGAINVGWGKRMRCLARLIADPLHGFKVDIPPSAMKIKLTELNGDESRIRPPNLLLSCKRGNKGKGSTIAITHRSNTAELVEAFPSIGQCAHCGCMKMKAELAHCARCASVDYCNRDCQVKDWKAHKGTCSSAFSRVRSAPSRSHYLTEGGKGKAVDTLLASP
ncbi:hypothetical protein BV25DRAFT_1062373 [Artomyces pyxidatus]|uniref:Uncharacterized protein n=1 Tax=Artomyces pyxidatus TaxID=48021 RepID=A0ACB8STD4_9AGAM|nr:hypothetical protein BV25DRAFT_1062373 [Artomyces pyxidatus]